MSAGLFCAPAEATAPAKSMEANAKCLRFIAQSPDFLSMRLAGADTLRRLHEGSKCDPYVEERGVVVPRIAAVSVVVGRRPVEFAVRGVLKHQADVLDRQVVELEDVAVAVRFDRVSVRVRA